MKNQLKTAFISIAVFMIMFLLSIQTANMFFMAIAMFALSVAFKRIANKAGFICFLLAFGFLFSSIVSPIFNALAQTPQSPFQLNSFF